MTDKPKIDDGGPLSSCSLRDHWAGLAMQGFVSANSNFPDSMELIRRRTLMATASFEVADIMIARKRETEGGK